MAYKALLNQGARARLSGYCPTETSTAFGFVAATKRITRSSGSFMPKWLAGMVITVSGSAANNNTFTIASIAADGSYMTVLETVVDAVAGASVTLTSAMAGMSLMSMFKGGCIGLYSGYPIADPDSAETGTLLALITLGGAALVPGNPATGLAWEMTASGIIDKPTAATWSGVGIAAGTIHSAYVYDNNVKTGAAADGGRACLSVGVGSGIVQLSVQNIELAGPISIQRARFTVPSGV
jgi:hypothetical protein